MTQEERKRFNEVQDATIGFLYKVCYIKNWTDYGKNIIRNNDILEYCKSEELRIDNINGWGIGFVFFINKDNKLVYLPWCAIISMVPIKE